MDILVFSDSHGNTERMKQVLERNRAEVVIHLGDGCRDIEVLAEGDSRRIFLSVRGNCDWLADGAPTERIFEWEGVRFLVLHGHTVNVKHGTETLEKYARAKNADIVLYGHTHVRDDRYLPGEEGERALRIFNPGSIGSSPHPSFGFIWVKNGQIMTNCSDYGE